MIIEIEKYTIPLHGNKHILPYGKIKVIDGKQWKIVNFGKIDEQGRNYFYLNRKRYFFTNIGSLWHPKFIIKEEEKL